jgi:serine/threonine protein kinase/tetratricopeptide (TPR) repeat protein
MNHPSQLEAMFFAALAKGSPEERASYLDKASAGDPDLRRRVEKMLTAQAKAGGFLEQPLCGTAFTNPGTPICEGPGSIIGPYKLMEQIGEGGMGLVFVAEQQHPVRRKVAFKVMKPGMDTRQVVARFEAERQALALMDHPNIARVHDGGETASGRPYFVMELVKGSPITEYCDQNQVPVRERLELFLDVCSAVQHAHQKGIIHRDIKPSNVLVMSNDGTPMVKVIDFGIAKAIGHQLTDKTIYTQFTQLVGSPLYMSPEQAGLSGVDVDTRTDIYALGVLLYELLTGTTPFEKERFKEAGYEELRRIIREEEPPKPSTRISTLGERATTVSTDRKSDPNRLSQSVRGELDWIVMKALEKDRNVRYETASAFAGDIKRYLHDEPVQACPPSAWYRLRKFARRNRFSFAIGTLGAAALILAAIGLAIANRLIMAEKSQKEDALKEAIANLQAADDNFEKACAAVDRMLTRVAEEQLRYEPGTVKLRRRLLEDAREFYLGFLRQKSTEPRLRQETARAYSRLGNIYHILGQPRESEEAYRQAIDLLEGLASEFPREPEYRIELADGHLGTASALGLAGRRQEEEQACLRFLSILEALSGEFPDQPAYRSKRIQGQIHLACVALCIGKYRHAEEIARDALGSAERLVAGSPHLRDYHVCRVHCRRVLANALHFSGQVEEAEKLQRQALDLVREWLASERNTNPEQRHLLAICLTELAQIQVSAGNSHEAEKYLREALLIGQHLTVGFPSIHEYGITFAGSSGVLNSLLVSSGRGDEAEKSYRSLLSTFESMAADSPAAPEYRHCIAVCQTRLGELLIADGHFREAEERLGEALRLYSRLAAEFPLFSMYWLELMDTRFRLRFLFLASGRFRAEEKACRESLAMAEKSATDFPSLHRFRYFIALGHHQLGEVLVELGRPEEAEKELRRGLEIWSALVRDFPSLGEYRSWLAWCHNDLADLFATCPATSYRDPVQAVEFAQKAVNLHPEKGAFWNTLGTAHYRAGDYPAAVRELEKAAKMHHGGDCYDWFFLAMSHWRLGQKSLARQFYDRAVAWMENDQKKANHDAFQHARFRRFRAEAAELLGLR